MADPPAEHVLDLLGALAYSELTAFSRLAADLHEAPALDERVALADLAVVEYGHFERLSARIRELGGDPRSAMAPFVAPVDAYHDRTTPSDWPERLVKAYVGDAIGTDFSSEVAVFVDERTRAIVREVAREETRREVVAALVRDAVESDPRVAGRLALWARRLLGEALSQAQRVVVDRAGLAALVAPAGAGDVPGAHLHEVAGMLTRITDRHQQRLAEVGLAT